ncbi:DedA family protein [Caldiplasma sukawensis]
MSSIITNAIEYVINGIIFIIQRSNYPGIFFLMFLEGLLLPIPSEVVMVFSGYLAFDNMLPSSGLIPEYIAVLLAGSLGNTLGAYTAYLIGKYGGRPAVLRYGSYIKLNERTLQMTERWFEKYGTISVFLTRLVPVFRTFISIPAGIAKMRLRSFLTLTFLGAILWDSLLIYLGLYFGPRWKDILGAFNDYTYISVGLALLTLYYIYKRLSTSRNRVKST